MAKTTPGHEWDNRAIYCRVAAEAEADAQRPEAEAETLEQVDPARWKPFRVRDKWVACWIGKQPADYWRKGMTFKAKKQDGRAVWRTNPVGEIQEATQGVGGR